MNVYLTYSDIFVIKNCLQFISDENENGFLEVPNPFKEKLKECTLKFNTLLKLENMRLKNEQG